MIVNVPEGATVRKVLVQPFRDLQKRGITQENWLNHIEELTDPKVTAFLNVEVGPKELEALNEARKAAPSITDRQRAYGMREFGI